MSESEYRVTRETITDADGYKVATSKQDWVTPAELLAKRTGRDWSDIAGLVRQYTIRLYAADPTKITAYAPKSDKGAADKIHDNKADIMTYLHADAEIDDARSEWDERAAKVAEEQYRANYAWEHAED